MFCWVIAFSSNHYKVTDWISKVHRFAGSSHFSAPRLLPFSIWILLYLRYSTAHILHYIFLKQDEYTQKRILLHELEISCCCRSFFLFFADKSPIQLVQMHLIAFQVRWINIFSTIFLDLIWNLYYTFMIYC